MRSYTITSFLYSISNASEVANYYHYLPRMLMAHPPPPPQLPQPEITTIESSLEGRKSQTRTHSLVQHLSANLRFAFGASPFKYITSAIFDGHLITCVIPGLSIMYGKLWDVWWRVFPSLTLAISDGCLITGLAPGLVFLQWI